MSENTPKHIKLFGGIKDLTFVSPGSWRSQTREDIRVIDGIRVRVDARIASAIKTSTPRDPSSASVAIHPDGRALKSSERRGSAQRTRDSLEGSFGETQLCAPAPVYEVAESNAPLAQERANGVEKVETDALPSSKLARASALTKRCALAGLVAAAGGFASVSAVAAPPPNCDDPPAPTTVVTAPTAGSSFRPAPSTINIASTSTGGVRVRTDYYANGTAIGQATASPWNLTWTNVPAGTYSIQARSVSKSGTCLPVTGPLSSPVSITVIANQPPAIGIAGPASGSKFLVGTNVPLSVSASDSDGSVSNVTYFANGSAISGALSSPYSFQWSGAAVGTYSVTAVATDNEGGQTTSAAISVIIRSNVAPSVGVSAPSSGTVSSAPGSFTFTASASDSDGSVSNVQWFANGSAISGALTSAPYTFAWSGVGAGSYSITARATDNEGGVTTSSPITVVSNDAPAVTLSPSGANGSAPGSITLQASASDSLGGVSNVQYFANGSAISGALTAAPYAFTWSGVAAGSYSIVARVTDGYGLTGNSAAYSFNVNAAPSVLLTSPTNGTVLNSGVPASVALSANASDSDGTISKVEFLVNGSVVATSTAAPYSATWGGVAAGTYSVQARATDNTGVAATSAASSLTVSTGNAAQFISQSVPATIVAGQSAAVSVTMKNIGASTWTSAANHKLGAQNPQDNSTWGLNRVVVPQTVAPGGTATFSFNITAPSAPGTYNFQWKMLQESIEWFGDLGTNVAVVSNDRPAATLNASNVNSNPPGSVTLQASTSDGLGGVSGVQYFANGSAISGALASAPYTFNWTGVPAGSYNIVARVTDTYGATGDSTGYNLTVYTNPLPSIAMLAPADGAIYAPGSALQLAAGVTSNGNSINKVEFYDGATLLGQATLSNGRYALGWSGASNGSHTITAKVTDSFGRTATSAGAAITVVAPAIPTPPNLSGSIAGSLAGKASVSPNGSATYAVSIPVPPGTAGLAPTLELAYSSLAGTGISGLGWSLHGLSAITRCGRTVAQDGGRAPVALTASDAYCLDGQRLILVSGTHGANAEYRTEVDRFSRVLSIGSDPAKGPDRWVVTSRTGITMNYGATVDSNIEAQGSNPMVVLTWAVSSMVDPRGNTVTYSYTKNSAIGEYAPTQIAYTSNPTTVPILAPYNAVRFEYQSRPDPVQAFVMGSKVSTTQRLTAIRTYTNTASDGSGGNVVRQFLVGYVADPNTGKSLVQSIQDCDASSTCLPSTTFAWTQRSAGDNTEYGPGTGNWGGMQVQVSAQHTTTDVRAKVRALDMNGDGRLDLISSTGDGNWQVCLSTGVNFNCQTWSGPTISYNASDPEDYAFNHVLFGDFNGDGKTDIAIIPAANNQDTTWTVCYSTGASFNCQATNFWSAGYQTGSGYNPSLSYLVGDFDGDGRDDLIGVAMVTTTTPYTYVEKLCKSTGSGFTCGSYSGVAGKIMFVNGDAVPGDFNGDGKTDFAVRTGTYPTDTYNTWTIYLAGPTGFTPAFSAVSASRVRDNYISSSGPFFKAPKDANGDPYGSYADLITTWIGGAELCRSTGKSLDCTVATGLNEYDTTLIDVGDFDGDGKVDVLSRYTVNHTTTPGKLRLCQVGTGATLSYGPCVDYTGDGGGMIDGDFNGDGLPDRAYYSSSSGSWTIRLAGATRPQLLSRVTDGYGAAAEFSYKLLADDSVYTQDSGSAAAAYPQHDVRDNTTVVSQMRMDNGQGGWFATDYKYGGLKTDLTGRGNLGFRWLEAYDEVAHVTTRSEFVQAFPAIGRTARIVSTHDNGVELKRVETGFAQMPTTAVSGIVFSYVASETQSTKDLNGAAISTTTTTVPATGAYDSYGNLLSQTVTVVGGGETFASVTTSAYDNVTATWQIGLERQTQVAKSAPGVASLTRTTAKDYDSYGSLLRETIEPNDNSLKLVTEYTRDGFGNVQKTTLKWTDPVTSAALQRDTATNTYDSRGRWPVTITNALGQSEIHDNSPTTGEITSLTGPNGLTTLTQYDGWGRKISESRPDGSATLLGYRQCVDRCGGAASVVVQQEMFGGTPIASASETFADRLGRVVQTRRWGFDGSAIFSQQQYDSNGRLGQVSRPYADGASPIWSQISYDDLGCKVSIDEPSSAGGTQQSTIDYNGPSATLTNPKGQTKTKVRNALGLVKQIVDAASNSTTYLYDPSGNLVRTTDALGNSVNITYDTRGRKTALQDPDLGGWSYYVDPLGQTYKQTDARQQSTTYTFDVIGRMIRRLEPDLDSYWVYDAAAHGIGKLSEAYTLRGDGTKDYRRVHSYDALSRPSATTLTLDQDYTSATDYDAYGRVAGRVEARNTIGGSGGPSNRIEYGYNAYGFLVQMRSVTAGGSRVEARTLVQDAQGRVTREAFGNGLYTDRRYNAYTGTLDSLSSGADNGSGGDNAAMQYDTYQYDSLNNLNYRSQRSDDVGGMLQESFGYDNLNRVTSSQVAGLASKSYGYDAIGNLTSRSGVGSYTYPSSGAGSVRPHAVSSITGTVDGLTNPSLAYDGNGNTLSGIGRNTTWTTANLPATISRTNALNATNVTATFVYGPEHQRVKQTLTSGVTLVYAESIEKETGSSGTRTKTYLPGGLGYIEETTVAPTPTTRYFHADRLGSVSVVTNAQGQVLERLSYDVWGQRRNADGSDDGTYALKANQDRTGYTAQEHLDELDLIHMNGRVYDPVIGRFTSADPTISDPTNHQNFNRYSYVLNNPLAYTDPSGFEVVFANSNTLSIASGSLGSGAEVAWDASMDAADKPKTDKEKEQERKENEKKIRDVNCAQTAKPAECSSKKGQAIADNNAGKVSGSNGSAGQNADGGRAAGNSTTKLGEQSSSCSFWGCAKQGMFGTLQAGAGALTAVTGAGICTTFIGCAFGMPMIGIGGSDATQGITKTYDALRGVASDGYNPIKSAAMEWAGPERGALAYDSFSLALNTGALFQRVPIFVDAAVSMGRSAPLFGSTVLFWDQTKGMLGQLSGYAGQLANRATRVFGIGNGAVNVTQDTRKLLTP